MADDQRPTGAVQSILELSAFNPAARDNPHPMLKAMREDCPVFRDETATVWLLSRYKDVRETVNDRTFVRHPTKAEEGSLSARFVEERQERGTSILFLDDDPDYLDMLGMVLPTHLQVELYMRPTTFLERMREELPVVVLSDIEMPGMDGFELVQQMRADPQLNTLPVVMITSRIADKHREHARQLGVDHYLGKPYSEEELLALVAAYARLAPQPEPPRV